MPLSKFFPLHITRFLCRVIALGGMSVIEDFFFLSVMPCLLAIESQPVADDFRSMLAIGVQNHDA
jgi:hypothetical protein